MSPVLGALAIVVGFLILIAPHEGGHFALAKLFGVHVKEYSVGMGTRLWSTVRGNTLYAFRLIPLGGYVRLAGMEPGDDPKDPDGFHRKAAYQRLLILAAGPVANFLLAAVLATGGYMTHLNSNPALVAGVIVPSPANSAGIRPGDSIIAVDGKPIQRASDIQNAESANPGHPLQFTIRHPNGEVVTLTIQPTYDPQAKRYIIGVENRPVLTPLDAVWNGVQFPVQAGQELLVGMWALVSGQIPGGILGPEGATGPIGIAAITYSAALSGFGDLLIVLAALSVALGLANLLPLPALDGGRMVVVLVEKVRGRPFDRDREMAVQRAGLVVLLVLFAFIAYFDIQRLVTHQFPGLR
ncbi:MAG TPA: site-2 protease family protein [Candidatus Dormibacteraeota bacterium]